MVDLRDVPGGDIHEEGGEGQRDDGALEPHRPNVGMAEDETHDEEDESDAEQMDMRYPNQREDIGPGVDLGDFLDVVVAVEVRQVWVAAIVAT
jgi:hypothetical protein